MADSKVSSLTATTSIADTDVQYIVHSSASNSVTMQSQYSYIASRIALYASSMTSVSPTAATDTYVAGSRIVLPTAAHLQVGSIYRCHIFVSKTATGTTAPVITLRAGTAGTTSDTSIAAPTLSTETNTANTGTMITVTAMFKAVGASATADVSVNFAGGAGFPTNGGMTNTSTAFNSGTASMGLGVSVKSGTGGAWTIGMVQTELVNLI